MSILVIGGTGIVGRQVVDGLLNRGEHVRVFTRSAHRAGALPQGAEGVVGDLRNPATFPPACRALTAYSHLTA